MILKTAGGERLVPLILPEGNSLAIDILDATLGFELRNGVTELNPAPGIESITLNKVDDNSIRLTITGENQAPSAEIIPGRDDLVLSITPEANIAQTEPDEEIEVIATGEGEDSDYVVTEANSATRTDVDISDTPQSVQVIPQQVLEDQQVIRLISDRETETRRLGIFAQDRIAFGEKFFLLGGLRYDTVEQIEKMLLAKIPTIPFLLLPQENNQAKVLN